MSMIRRTTTQHFSYPSLFAKKLALTALLIISSLAGAYAQGDLLISPLRVVFEGNKKSQEISLANVGKDTAVYAVSIVDIRMKEDGSFETITTPDSGQLFAGPYMRFFPRKVVLAPNESQVVKVQLMKTSQMTPGEYRSHLYFRAVPEERPLGDAPSKKDSASISIQLKPIFGITIPVIIRNGDNNADVSLSDMKLAYENNKYVMGVTFNRSGSMSVYGDLMVYYVPPTGKQVTMKTVKGLGVYTPNALRRFRVELDEEKNFDPKKGKLRAVYTLQTNDKTPKTKEIEMDLK
ncbi:hypothetical protein GCM10023093_12040 [Nemorincola caseinilytica]|uniref:Molecular chaperone n=1 Tax=Nemorincola caseinilytica TaxID=2054315 RepID=A0ABP8N991_9BACT